MTPTDARAVTDGYRRHVSRGRARLAELTGGLVEVASEGAWSGRRRPRLPRLRRVRRLPPRPPAPRGRRRGRRPAAAAPDGHPADARADRGPGGRDAGVGHARGPGLRALRQLRRRGDRGGDQAGPRARPAHAGLDDRRLPRQDHGRARRSPPTRLYQAPFRPLLPDVVHVPFGDAAALGAVLAGTPDACVVLEPVQGEGGVVLPPAGLPRRGRRGCAREAGALLVLDEMQTGLGRLGTLVGRRPRGRPARRAAGRQGPVRRRRPGRRDGGHRRRRTRRSADDPFLHTSTFAGSPIAMAAATAAVTAIRDEGLVERSRGAGRAAAGATCRRRSRPARPGPRGPRRRPAHRHRVRRPGAAAGASSSTCSIAGCWSTTR